MDTEAREVLFENRQWRVDEDGVESVDPAPEYWFEAKRLSETTARSGETFYDWPLQMADKTWIDIEAFIEAFTKALELHAGKYAPPVDEDMLARSVERARREARRR
ncbi:hypothetical protein ABIE45_006286 [Methylobacterium sp. OAE515]|uniref:hypothetical protein n=1 Tax=Methylobacterium sp. OAE515 TaxID=2817895 RepID=UPI00178BBA6A